MIPEELIEPIARALLRWRLEAESAHMVAEGKATARAMSAAIASGVENNWQVCAPEAREILATIQTFGWRIVR